MQEALGADFTDLTDLNGSAQSSSDNLVMARDPHFSLRASFTPLSPLIARRADALNAHCAWQCAAPQPPEYAI